MIATGPIEAFFKSPMDPPSGEGDCLLYHLRTDLESLYGMEASSASVSPSHVLLATTGILNGIDYMSQVYSTESNQRKRFTEALRDLVGVPADAAEALFQLRCAVVHQVGLSILSTSYRKGTRFIFELTDAPGKPTILKSSDSGSEVNYAVGFWELKRSFIAMVVELRRVCENPAHSRHAHVINMVGQMHSEKLLKQ